MEPAHIIFLLTIKLDALTFSLKTWYLTCQMLRPVSPERNEASDLPQFDHESFCSWQVQLQIEFRIMNYLCYPYYLRTLFYSVTYKDTMIVTS